MSTFSAGHDERFVASVDGVAPVRERRWLCGALVGAVAGLAASGAMLWAGDAWGGVILAQLLSDRMTGIIPTSLFGQALGELESNAKPLTLAGLTFAQVMGGAIIGAGYARFGGHRGKRRLADGVVLSAAIWALLALVAAPLGEVGLLALDAPGDVWRTQATFVLAAVVFGVLVAAFVPWPTSRQEDAVAPDSQRRRLIQVAGLGALALPALWSAGYVGREVQQLRSKGVSPEPLARTVAGDGPFAFAGMPQEITPTDEFYVVSKNFQDPTVDSSSWTLEVGGMVDTPLTLSYSDLLARDSVEFISTLECISNSVGGKYISTATWAGFPLVELLREAGLHDGIVDIELHAADGYVESIPLAEGLAEDTMVVHSMNGEPLNDEHGAPARLIVPGIFGMKNVKWLTKVVAVNEDIQGFWQERGWSDPAPVVTMSKISTPRAGQDIPIGRPFKAGGVAFAGDRGIQRVEVSFDGGVTWSDAQLSDPLSPLAWRLWSIEHTPAELGEFWITVRATDGTGAVQTAEERPTLPDGATGHHDIRVTIRAA
ncbi:MAG TPA: molybdopterin-dependent oxidoreductase [Thermomicrobiales bacterium]|nr:molybdopterin-dependent oxidoreductase [Thermomicrobiales bacterium]